MTHFKSHCGCGKSRGGSSPNTVYSLVHRPHLSPRPRYVSIDWWGNSVMRWHTPIARPLRVSSSVTMRVRVRVRVWRRQERTSFNIKNLYSHRNRVEAVSMSTSSLPWRLYSSSAGQERCPSVCLPASTPRTERARVRVCCRWPAGQHI